MQDKYLDELRSNNHERLVFRTAKAEREIVRLRLALSRCKAVLEDKIPLSVLGFASKKELVSTRLEDFFEIVRK